MGLFTNPLGHAGYPPGVTGTPTTQPASIRAAKQSEVTSGTLKNVYVSPSTLAAASSPTVGSAGASPRTVNGKYGVAIFSSVSIAAGATQSFTILNSSVTSSSRIIYSMVGATTGAALSIQSVTNTSGQSVVVVTNGTGATTTTANIAFTFQVLN